ncbi:bacillithiol system redox-active protein YtxJ [Brumimicrobium salinarum]|uniref:Bacillithiol system redox-active protein YtxJ n=1 Tax=Brumimicrobium salinarum TaxID=2058658 RepID=A0A2I0R5Y9_9FLAO|nr:bacillithiol system redox-active protein YtxJ [Brumimicrobium salinarum]PKR82002.1 bacillithiol system redox-active protein YtxJ [Brumimicrobium salinarum]
MGLFSFKKKSNSNQLNWKNIDSTEDLKQAFEASKDLPVVFFKHSTRCSISSMALSRFEKDWNSTTPCTLCFIDLIANRPVSNALAELTGVEHQSPQVIVVKNKEVILTDTHNGISASAIQNIL